ncbi:MAG TPA: OmpA family protein [bacterium]|nr:OmpA family protein [bacterium]
MTPVTPRTSAPADAGLPQQDASIPAQDAGASADAGPAAVLQDPPQTIVFGRASVGAADHGGRNGAPFAYQSIGQFGDWINLEASVGLLRDLNSGPARFRLGGSLGYNRMNGGENVSGSHINTLTLNPRAELDISRLLQVGPVSFLPRLGLEVGLGYGFGSSTVDGGFQIHDQSGFAVIPRIDLGVLDVRLGNLAVGLGAYVSSPAVFGNEHNSAFLSVGGQMTFYTPFETRTVVEEACSADRRGDLVRRIHLLQSESAQLREENTTTASFLEGIHSQLLQQGVSDDDLRSNIRSGLVAHIENLQSGENPLPRADIIAQLRRLYGNYLRNRSENPVTDPAERQRLAREQFPDDFDPSTAENRTAAAQAIFPDDFDPYAFRTVEEVSVPEPLPQDCDGLEDLRTRLEDERADLREQRGLLEGLTRMGLTRLGVPTSSAPNLIRAITRLSEIHFITARPQGAPDRVSVSASDIAPLNAAADAWGRDHRGEVRPQTEIDAAFRAIFPRTRRAPTDTTPNRAEEYSPALEVIRQISETLRSPEMRGAHFYVVGHTDSRGDDAMNQRLSLRRAQAIRDALIFYGVDPEMITPLGRGESQLVYYYDQPAGGRGDVHRVQQAEVRMLNTDGVRGTALQDEIRGRQAVNRRIEMFICMPNTRDETCTQLDAEIRASSSPRTEGSAETRSAGGVVTSVVIPEETSRRRSGSTRRERPAERPATERPDAGGTDAGRPDMDFTGGAEHQ